MGQACSNTLFPCADCNSLNSYEVLSEHSLKTDNIRNAHSIKDARKDPVVHCIENMDLQIAMYEKEFAESKSQMLHNHRPSGLDESHRQLSPQKPKIISRNATDKSVNLIDKLARTSDTDKSFSSNNAN
jgi:hypothetical protein